MMIVVTMGTLNQVFGGVIWISPVLPTGSQGNRNERN